MQFDRDKFARAVGSTFILKDTEGQSVGIELAEVSEARERPHQLSFSITFLAPESMAVEQGLYDVEHEGLGTMQLFLVPVGMKEGRMELESVFNFLKEE
jgi:hypothetical protein